MEPEPKGTIEGIIGKSFLFPNLPQEAKTYQDTELIFPDQVQNAKNSDSPNISSQDIFPYFPKTPAPINLP